MISLNTRVFELPLKHPFGISRGTSSASVSLIVEACCGGERGYGEATVNDYYGSTVENMTSAITLLRPVVGSSEPGDPGRTIAQATSALPGQGAAAGESFALCAVDEALHDLWGKLRREPLHHAWGLDPQAGPASSYTIGIDALGTMVAKLREEPGWPAYKIKLGTPDDLAIVRALRRETDALLRVDANCGWTAEQAIELSHELRSLGVDFVEQPLPAGDWDGMQRVYRESALPVFADESCVSESDVEACHEHFHGVNIKLMKCGGLAAARRMISRARRLGMGVMIGCMTESTVGISAAAQLLPLVDYADLDGATLLARDVATGVQVIKGRCRFRPRPGTGVTLCPG